MNLELAEQLTKRIEEVEAKADKVEDVGIEARGDDYICERDPEWMTLWKEQVQLSAQRYQVGNEGSEIQFNEDKTQFRVVTDANREAPYW